MVVRAVLAGVVLLGCNRVLGLDPAIEIDAAIDTPDADPSPDLDGDHIPDDVDPCISAAADLAADFDRDSVADATDPCPFDTEGAPDADGDGIPDICDPFPANAGDDQRCFFGFRDPNFFNVFWEVPSGGWTFDSNNGTIVSVGDSTLRVVESIETHDVTVYDVSGFLDEIAATAQVQVLARTSQGTTSDTGCKLDASATDGILHMVGDTTDFALIHGSAFGRFRMRITIEPDKAINVRCELHLLSTDERVTVSGHETLKPGVFGVAATSGPLTLDGIAVYHRTDALPL